MVLKSLKFGTWLILTALAILFIVFFIPAIWRNLVIYPKLDKAVAELNKLWQEPSGVTDFQTYRGIIHAHSFWSHDSEGTLHDLVPAAKNNGIDFIFLTDHPRHNLDTFPRGYSGYYDGVLIEPGSEKQKFGVWPLDSAVIDWKTDKDTLAKQVVDAGGLLVYVHTEEPHNWGNPYYQGMEIYNFHTDTKDEKLLPHIVNFLVNGKKYRHWALREMFDEQTEILALWDSLNTHRKIFGFSAVDTHENQNIRARQLDDGRIQWVGPNAKPFDTVNVNFWNRWLFHEPDENGWVFKLMIDTYNEGFNYVTNYVLADTLSVMSLAKHIKKGHLYTAFKSLGDAKGFLFWSENVKKETSGILGDSVQINQAVSFHAVSPLPGQFRLIHNGKPVDISSDESYEYAWEKPLKKGVYRIELHVKLRNKLVPWLYTNPIYIY
ncbi:MAG: hypothetical protein K0B11_09455 [Mariniphaga sp.]|nr:hypothetical protein [Mariniphaga sp.]